MGDKLAITYMKKGVKPGAGFTSFFILATDPHWGAWMLLLGPDKSNWGADRSGRQPLWLTGLAGERAIRRAVARTETSEWQENIHDLLAVAWLLDVCDLTTSAVGNARFSNLFRGDRIVRGNVFRADDTGNDQFPDLEVDADFLTSLNHHVAVGQNLKHDGGDGGFDGFRPIDFASTFRGRIRSGSRDGRGVDVVGDVARQNVAEQFGAKAAIQAQIVRCCPGAFGRVVDLGTIGILTLTVRMSPTRLARWSLKKAREPVCHSELGL